jgi:hypothetical protein
MKSNIERRTLNFCRYTQYALRIAYCLILTACTLPASHPPAPSLDLVLVTVNPGASLTPTPFQPAPAATAAPVVLPAPSETLPPTQPPAAASLPAGTRPQYTFYINLDYYTRQAAVQQTIQYPNQTGAPLEALVLSVQPNLWPNCFLLDSVTQEETPLNVTLNGQHMTVALLRPLQPGETATLSLGYQLNLPAKKFEGTFGYLGYQLNLTNWYPFVVPYDPAQGWILHDPWAFGEHLVYDSADFDLYLSLAEGSEKVIVAASSPGMDDGEWIHYRLEGARTFVLSASDQFKVVESGLGSLPIRSYYFGKQGAGERIASAATQAVAIFQSRFGPYPYPSLSIVATESPDGQEFDGLVFLSEDFYAQYQGGIKNNLVSVGVHEVAHQWWFGLVGSDQALEPWLDEALATYSERVFYEHYDLTTWWWGFRVNYFSPAGWVDTNIYDGIAFRPYTNAVYLRGAKFIEALRLRMGDKAFFAFLQDYAARHAHSRAASEDFFAILREHTDADISDLLAAYFQQAR